MKYYLVLGITTLIFFNKYFLIGSLIYVLYDFLYVKKMFLNNRISDLKTDLNNILKKNNKKILKYFLIIIVFIFALYHMLYQYSILNNLDKNHFLT